MNINEIARLAGVSRATVSRYLNNGYVSSEKKEVHPQGGSRRQDISHPPRHRHCGLKKTQSLGVILPKDQFRYYKP